MEVECPDVWPQIRVLPPGFEVEWYGCCGGWHLYYGVAYTFQGVFWQLTPHPETGEFLISLMGHLPWSPQELCGMWETSAKVSGESGKQCCL